MNRRSRIISNSGIYHIMNRSAGKIPLFYNHSDFDFFMEQLKKLVTEFSFTVHAYCLMSDHFHLLIEVPRKNPDASNMDYEKIACFMRRLDSSYAKYYNIKNERQGVLFQDRYISVPVKNDTMFLTEVLYIHNNPVKAHMVEHGSDYAHSSLHCYGKDGLTDNHRVYSLIGKDGFEKMTAAEELRARSGKDFRVDFDELHGRGIVMTDPEALQLAVKTLGITMEVFRTLTGKRMAEAFHKLKELSIPVSQIARICQIPAGRIRHLLWYWGKQKTPNRATS